MPKKLSNPILSIPADKDFRIPIYFSDFFKKSYISHLKDTFKKTSAFLIKCNERYFEPSKKDDVLERIVGFQSSLINVINEYLEGHPSKSYLLFTKALSDFKVDQELKSVQQLRVKPGTNFYRSQRHFGETPKKFQNQSGFLELKNRFDLFHPPFERRRSVGTNRFSISGYPSLYLSSSLQTSYSECFPDKRYGPFNAINFKNVRPLYFIDLTTTNLLNKEPLFEGILPKHPPGTEMNDIIGIIEYLGIYQLIMASHTKVSYEAIYKGEPYYFKAEYIIPQLLLQWVKLQGLTIDGIRYTSCTANSRFPKNVNHYNFVLPVRSSLSKGYCNSLKSLFYASDPYNHLLESRPKNSNLLLNQIMQELEDASYELLAK